MGGDQLVHHVHDGSDHHYQALLANDSSEGRTVIILTNQKRGNVYAMNDAINAILDGKPYAPLSNKPKWKLCIEGRVAAPAHSIAMRNVSLQQYKS
jgi:hypothetical protein